LASTSAVSGVDLSPPIKLLTLYTAMRKKTKFAAVTAWILLSRSYDAYCTNQLTPDLSKESNPLVSVFGMTWTPLLIVLSLLTVYTIYTYYIRVFKPKDLLPAEKGYTPGEVSAYTYLGRKDSWTAIFYKFPKDLKRFNHYMGHTLPACLAFAGVVSTSMWLLINYTEFYKTIHNAPAVYAILTAGCALIIYSWNKTMYRRYSAATSSEHSG
jgi:hypothetical protein